MILYGGILLLFQTMKSCHLKFFFIHRYSLLSGGSSGSENYESGRTGFSRVGLTSGSRDVKGGRLSQGRDRGKTGAKVSQEKERESALAAAR